MAHKKLNLNEKKGLWANIHAKRARGEKMNPKGHPDAPSSKEMKMAQEAIQRRMDRMVIIATDPATGRKVVKIAPKKEILIGKGKQESDTLREQTDAKKANNISVPNVNIPDGEQESSDDIPPLIVPMKRGRKNLRKTKGSGTTIMVIEKPVESSSNMSGPAMSGGKTKTLNIDAMKKSGKNIMKKLHKIILQ